MFPAQGQGPALQGRLIHLSTQYQVSMEGSGHDSLSEQSASLNFGGLFKINRGP